MRRAIETLRSGGAVRPALRSMLHTAALPVIGRLGDILFRIPPTRRKQLETRSNEGPHGDHRWFTLEEAELVSVLASLIVPSDEDAPGAAEIEVLGTPAVRQIDTWVASDRERQRLYTRGLVALNELAQRRYNARFVDIPAATQRELLAALDALRRGRLDSNTSGPGKVRRHVMQLYGMWEGSSAAIDLFAAVVSDTFKAFYSSEVASIWLDYDGPPMPLGYPTPTLPRPRGNLRPAAGERLNVPRSGVTGAASVDVVVIGSGAGGAVAAKELSEAGLSVVVVESGRRYHPAEYATQGFDFEVRGKETFKDENASRDVYTTRGSKGFSYNRVKGVGGSTLRYAAMSPRFHEADFRVYTEDGVAADWPITYADLEPYYTRVEYELGVSGPDGANPFEPPRSRPYPTPPHPFNLASLAIQRGADKLGLHMVREPLALPSADWQGRAACVGAGTCHLGCFISAKSSMDVTYVRKAEASGRVDVRTECTATEIEVDNRGRACAVIYTDKSLNRHRVGARAVVLAGNAVETPRLLLMSTSKLFPHGLANSSGLVGLNFMEHLAVFMVGHFDERLDPWRGTPTGGMIQDYYATRAAHGFARGWTTLVTANSHWPLATAGRIPGWGHEHKEAMKKVFGRSVCLASIGEQLPDARNRVVLDPAQTDVFGLPAPCLLNEPHENDAAMIRTISQHMTELLEAAGAHTIRASRFGSGASSHYLGTCRMGNDPKTSVVDAWCRAHDVPNLFIADGSVFVTGAAVNPALTISALASRTSDGIVAAFRRGEL
jgi:choline dehydrogenase-like flavoprotein